MTLGKSKSIEADLHAVSKLEDGKEENLTFCQKFKLIFSNITVEPIMICYIFPNVMASLATQNLNLEKACRVNLEYSDEICDALAARNVTQYKYEEVQVQQMVALAMACKNVIQSLAPSLLLLFLGSWSDRHNRRKPCILFPIVGEIITVTGFLICTYYFYQLPIVYNVIAEAVPPAITGGWFSMFMGVYSYISSISNVETRTLRIGAVNMFSNVSVTIGIALSGILYKQIGFYGVFSLTLTMYIAAFIYGLLRVRECPPDKAQIEEMAKVTKEPFFKDFFDLKHIRDTFRVAFKDGERNRKRRICTIMVLVMVIIGPMHGEMNVMYLFVRYKFNWDELDYSIYSTFNFVAHVMGTLFSLVVFSKFMKLDDALLGMISSCSKIASCFVYAFAPTSYIFYLGAILEMLNGTSFIAMRSIISKMVPPDELGKIYSLFGVSEALMPLVYGPMYSIIYNKTINILPGAFFLAGGVLTTPAILIFFWLYTEHKKDEKENKLKEQEEVLLKDMAAVEENVEKS